MLKWIRGIGFAVIFGLTAPLASAAPAQTPRAPVLLVLGDSLSAEYGIARGTGWVALLQQALKKDGFDYSVVNASISGDTTSDGMARLPALLSRYRPAITVIELGANDALRGIPLSLTERNLHDMVSAARRAQSRVMLIGMRIPPNYGPDYTERFFNMFGAIAKAQRLAYTQFLLDGIAGRRDLFQEDQMHPLAVAQPYLLRNVWPALRPLLGKPAPTKPVAQ